MSVDFQHSISSAMTYSSPLRTMCNADFIAENHPVSFGRYLNSKPSEFVFNFPDGAHPLADKQFVVRKTGMAGMKVLGYFRFILSPEDGHNYGFSPLNDGEAEQVEIEMRKVAYEEYVAKKADSHN